MIKPFKATLIKINPPTEKMLEIEKENDEKSLEPQKKFQRIVFRTKKNNREITVTNKNRAWVADWPDIVYEITTSSDGKYIVLESLKIADIDNWSNQKIIDYAVDAEAISTTKAKLITAMLNDEGYDDNAIVYEMKHNFDQFKTKLYEIKGIGLQSINNLNMIVNGHYGIKKIKKYFEEVKTKKALKLNIDFPFHVPSDGKIMKLMDKADGNENAVLTQIQANPFQFIHEFDGDYDKDELTFKLFSFGDADIIHFCKNNSSAFDENRLQALTYSIFRQAYQQQNKTYLSKKELMDIVYNPKTIKLNQADPELITDEKAEKIVAFIENFKDVVAFTKNNETQYSIKNIYQMQQNIATFMLDHQNEAINKIDDETIEDQIEQFEAEKNFRLSEKQIESIRQLINQPLTILTGFAGTGKSTIVSCAINVFEKMNLKVIGCAFTGKAAQNLASIAQNDAHTIHKILYSNIYHDFDHKIDADVIIIDEVSMCPMSLFAQLVQKIKPKTRIILLGDEGQLGPINDINILTEFNKVKNQLKYIELTEPQRQKAESAIIKHSTYFRKGMLPDFNQIPTSEDAQYTYHVDNDLTYFISKTTNIDSVIYAGTQKYIDYIQNGKSTKDVQIIAPERKDVTACNITIQKALIEMGIVDEKQKYPIPGKITLHVNDRILNTRNKEVDEYDEDAINYSNSVYYPNGMLGTVQKINIIQTDKKTKVEIIVKTDNNRMIVLHKEALADIELAYAITVHKSQGSTIKNVIFVSGQAYIGNGGFLNKKLSYTAITRANGSLSICCNNISLKNFILESLPQRAMLSEMIQGEMSAG